LTCLGCLATNTFKEQANKKLAQTFPGLLFLASISIKGVMMKHLFTLSLLLLAWSYAQTPAQKIARAFELFELAPYWSYEMLTVDNGETTNVSASHIAPDSCNFRLWSDTDSYEVYGIKIDDTAWVRGSGEPWQEVPAEEMCVEFSEEDFLLEGATITSLGRDASLACDRYQVAEAGLEICIYTATGLPAHLKLSESGGYLDMYYFYNKPKPITPPVR
jgi:hypothetical protein